MNEQQKFRTSASKRNCENKDLIIHTSDHFRRVQEQFMINEKPKPYHGTITEAKRKRFRLNFDNGELYNDVQEVQE
jgi:hypothetical protein